MWRRRPHLITSIRTPGSPTGSARSWCSGVHGSASSSRPRPADLGPVRPPARRRTPSPHQCAALRPGHVLDQLTGQFLVPPGVRRDRQPQQLGLVQQPDGENPPVPAPRPDRRGRRLRTRPPEPAQVSRMQLHRRPVLLPLPQHAHSLAQPISTAAADCPGSAGRDSGVSPVGHRRSGAAPRGPIAVGSIWINADGAPVDSSQRHATPPSGPHGTAYCFGASLSTRHNVTVPSDSSQPSPLPARGR
jgi:hypothetical protein